MAALVKNFRRFVVKDVMAMSPIGVRRFAIRALSWSDVGDDGRVWRSHKEQNFAFRVAETAMLIPRICLAKRKAQCRKNRRQKARIQERICPWIEPMPSGVIIYESATV
jgi:hypothetical protein